ncbi:unnamed protein product [Sphagnum jensenii]|uniref:Uncharacterized protein n=1 Tax=Sphagnum jensenii TaxID=128206 RepID=A0ABP0X802_9BRYO
MRKRTRIRQQDDCCKEAASQIEGIAHKLKTQRQIERIGKKKKKGSLVFLEEDLQLLLLLGETRNLHLKKKKTKNGGGTAVPLHLCGNDAAMIVVLVHVNPSVLQEQLPSDLSQSMTRRICDYSTLENQRSLRECKN